MATEKDDDDYVRVVRRSQALAAASLRDDTDWEFIEERQKRMDRNKYTRNRCSVLVMKNAVETGAFQIFMNVSRVEESDGVWIIPTALGIKAPCRDCPWLDVFQQVCRR